MENNIWLDNISDFSTIYEDHREGSSCHADCYWCGFKRKTRKSRCAECVCCEKKLPIIKVTKKMRLGRKITSLPITMFKDTCRILKVRNYYVSLCDKCEDKVKAMKTLNGLIYREITSKCISFRNASGCLNKIPPKMAYLVESRLQ